MKAHLTDAVEDEDEEVVQFIFGKINVQHDTLWYDDKMKQIIQKMNIVGIPVL